MYLMILENKAIAFSDVRNEKSIRLLERVGMRRQAYSVGNDMSKGEWVDGINIHYCGWNGENRLKAERNR